MKIVRSLPAVYGEEYISQDMDNCIHQMGVLLKYILRVVAEGSDCNPGMAVQGCGVYS